MDKNKKIITGLLVGAAAVNSAAIAAILTIRCSNSESINDHILHKIKELDDEVISKTNDLVNNPNSKEIFNNAQKMYDDALLKEKEIKNFIFNNKLVGNEIDDALKKLNDDIKKLKEELENNRLYNIQRAKELIDKISNNNPHKEKLLEIVNKNDVTSEQLWDVIEKTENLLNKAKEEALKEINKLNDSEKKNELLKRVNDINAKEEDYLSAKQEAINELEKARDKAISQINRLNNSSEKEKLLKIVNNPESTEEEINKSKESAENLLNKAKENALKELEKLTGSTKKDELSEKLNKENISEQEIKNIVNEVNEIFENEKERVKQLINSELTTDAEKENLLAELEKAKNIEEIKLVEAKIAPIKEIETISNEELKSNLLDKVHEINSKTENALDKLRDLETEAQLAKLPYPLGMEAPTVSEIRNRINDINSNEALNDLEKETKVKEIKDTFANLIEKINNAKDKIAKVSEARQAALNDILNNSNLIVNDDVNNNAEFEALDQAITNALNQDKSDAKDIIDSLSHLTNKQKEDFKNLIDEATSNNDIKKILDSAKLQDQKEDKKAELDRIIESLDYPNTNAEAKNELKDLYKEDKTLEELEQIKQLIVGENGVESKVNDANSKISKLPEAKQQALKDELNNASTNEEFEELFNKIAQALNDSKQEIKDEIAKLTHLTPEQRKELEKAVDAATNSTELNKILNKAKLLDKIEEAKSLITPNESYALADDPEVRNIIDRTINNMHKEADALETEAEVNNKIQELTALNEKLKEVKNSIENLTDNEVSNLEETKKELAKKLARVNDIDDIPFVNFEIDKEKVKKLAESLDYPSKPNNVAISDIKLLIDQIDTTNLDEAKAKLDKIKNQIENTDAELPLATKIQEAKDKIAEIRQSDKVDRITPLEAELDRANTKEEFEALLNNIQIAKDAADKEWRDNLRDSLKKQAESLPYPAGVNAQGIKDIKNIIDSLTDDELVDWQTTKLNEIDKKIKDANKEIAKLSSDDQTRLNEKLNSANTDEEFNQLFEDIRNSSATEKQNITDAINSLNYLSRDEKDNFIAQLENATSEEMNEVLVEAKKQNIDNLIDTLPYPSGSLAKAKSDLKADIAKINNSNDLDSKLAEIESFTNAINKAKQRILDLPTSDNSTGVNNLNELLDKAKTLNDINNIANQELKNKLEEYANIINNIDPVSNYPFNSASVNKLNNLLDNLPGTDQDETDLEEAIFNEKANKIANLRIDNLTNLNEENKNLLKEEISILRHNNFSTLTRSHQLKNKLNSIDEIIKEAIRRDLKFKIDKLPYPGNDLNNDQNDSQNVINSLDSLNDNIDNLTDEEVRNKLSEINNLEAKINSLKTDAENIQDNTEKARINALIDQLININNSSDIELEIEKAKAKDEVNNLSNLSNDQKTSFNNRINLAVDSNAITSILEEAKLQNKKEALKLEVDSIPYPNVDSTTVSNSKKAIKDAIENINSEIELTNKRTEIENIKEKMVIKKAEVENLGYKDPNALAKTSIKKGLDNITTLSDFNKVLPDDWSNKVNKYKEIIKKYFGDNSELMNNRFNKTYPDNLLGSPDNLNETNLKIQLFSTLKNEVSAYINSVNNFITPDEKSSLLQRLNAILEPSSATTPEQTEEILKQINDLHIEAKKTYFKGFINSLSVPNTTINGENMMDNFAKAKAEMIKTIVDPINSKNQFEATQRSLDSIVTELTNVKRKINAFSANDQVAKDIFSLEMSKISTAQGYIDLAAKIDKYNELIAKINNIPAFTSGGTQKQIAKANDGLDTLKNSLRSKLASASTIQDMQNLDSFLTKNVELVQSLRTTLSGDILVTKRLLEEASTKTDSASLTEIANRARELNTALQNNFWTPTKANELRGPLRDRWLMGPENVRFNIDDPDANLNNYFNYDDLVDKVLTRTTSADIRKITDVEIPKYKKLVETKSKAAEISSLIPSGANDSNPAKRAIESLKYIALTDATASDIETTNKYLGNVVRNQSGQVTSGFYKDAIDTLNSIGNDTNKSVFKGLLDNVATSLKDTNVKTNIDNLRTRINEFKLAYDSANTSLNNFRNSYGVTQQQIQEFQNRLNNVTNKEQADQLKNDIDAAINNANQRKQNDIRNTEATINSLPNGNSERDRLTNLLNSEKVKPNVTPSDLENIKNQATNLKAQIDTALRESSDAVDSLPNGNTLKESLRNKIINAPNTQETNDLSEINSIKDQAIAEKRNLDAKRAEAQRILDGLQDKQDYQQRINEARNIAELDEIIREMQTPKVLNKDEARSWANNISTTATSSPVSRAEYLRRIENATTKPQLDSIISDIRIYLENYPRTAAKVNLDAISYGTHRITYPKLKARYDATWNEDEFNEIREQAARAQAHPEF